jgi:hypothetical protein
MMDKEIQLRFEKLENRISDLASSVRDLVDLTAQTQEILGENTHWIDNYAAGDYIRGGNSVHVSRAGRMAEISSKFKIRPFAIEQYKLYDTASSDSGRKLVITDCGVYVKGGRWTRNDKTVVAATDSFSTSGATQYVVATLEADTYAPELRPSRCTISLENDPPVTDTHNQKRYLGKISFPDSNGMLIEQWYQGDEDDQHIVPDAATRYINPPVRRTLEFNDTTPATRHTGELQLYAVNHNQDGWKAHPYIRLNGSAGDLQWATLDKEAASIGGDPTFRSLQYYNESTPNSTKAEIYRFHDAVCDTKMHPGDLFLYRKNQAIPSVRYADSGTVAAFISDCLFHILSDCSIPVSWVTNLIHQHHNHYGLGDDDHKQYWINGECGQTPGDYTRNYGYSIGNSDGDEKIIDVDGQAFCSSNNADSWLAIPRFVVEGRGRTPSKTDSTGASSGFVVRCDAVVSGPNFFARRGKFSRGVITPEIWWPATDTNSDTGVISLDSTPYLFGGAPNHDWQFKRDQQVYISKTDSVTTGNTGCLVLKGGLETLKNIIAEKYIQTQTRFKVASYVGADEGGDTFVFTRTNGTTVNRFIRGGIITTT